MLRLRQLKEKRWLIILGIIALIYFLIIKGLDSIQEKKGIVNYTPYDFMPLFNKKYEVLRNLNYNRSDSIRISTFAVKNYQGNDHEYYNVVIYRLARHLNTFSYELEPILQPIGIDMEDPDYADVIQNFHYGYLKTPRKLNTTAIIHINSDTTVLVHKSKDYVSYYFQLRALSLFYDTVNTRPEVFIQATQRFDDDVIPMNMALMLKNNNLYLILASITYKGQHLDHDFLDKILDLPIDTANVK
jgi:hypothetical protein